MFLIASVIFFLVALASYRWNLAQIGRFQERAKPQKTSHSNGAISRCIRFLRSRASVLPLFPSPLCYAHAFSVS